MRAAYLLLSILSTSAWAESWQLHPDIGIKAADVYLSSRNPADQYGSTFKALQGQLRLRREDTDSLWETTGALEAAQANEAAYGESSFNSRYLARDKLSSSNFAVSYRQTHGFDPIGQLIEEAATKDDRSFESIYAGIYHQIALDLKNDISAYVGGGQNTEGDLKIESRDAQLSWDHHHSLLWTSRIRARITEAESRQREVLQEHLLRFTPRLSSQFSYGYAWQDHTEQSSQGALWGLELAYRGSGLLSSASAYQALSLARDVSPEEVANLRGSSMFKVGWTHARDQRRAGDPYYYADIFYGTSKIEFFGKQTLELKGSHSRASEHQLIDSKNDFQSEIVQGIYELPHRFMSRYPDAALALSYAAERTELPPRRYFREIYQASYKLSW